MFTKILSHVGKYWVQSVLSPITIMGEVAMEVLIPYVMAAIINNGINNGDIGYVARMGGLMVCMALVSLFFGAVAGRFSAVAAVGFAKNLRAALFRKVQSFSFANVDKFSTASLTTRLTTDVTNVQNAYMMFIRMAFRAPIMLIFALVMALKMNLRLSTVFFCAIPVIIIGAALILSNAHPRFKAMLTKYDDMNASVQENLIGIRTVKAFVREDYEKKKFTDNTEAVRAAQVRAEKLIILSMPLMQMVMYASIVAILWFGSHMIVGGTMELGDLTSFITYVSQILMSLLMLSFLFMMFVISRASIQRIYEVLIEEPDIVSPTEPVSEVADGSVSFRGVSFSYFKDMNNLALDHIDLDIKSGETVGIIGGTGSSKTSLVQLIPRLYDTTEGDVLVGGVNVRDYDVTALRDNVAMVLQKNVLFSGTIRDNLKWGDPNATDEEIQDACKSACAHDFIMGFPDGYDTDLGQGGVNVSGGQKQRLCIARALLKRPRVLVLDDSTSACDTATDAAIRRGLRTALPGTTKMIIAQRILSVRDCDRIVVMENGQVVAFDTHERLLQSCRPYREIYDIQTEGTGDFDAQKGGSL